MAKKVKKAKTAAPKGNWIAKVDIAYTRGPKNEDVKDVKTFLVQANDRESAEKAATVLVKETMNELPNLKLSFSTRALSAKENEKLEEDKSVPAF